MHLTSRIANGLREGDELVLPELHGLVELGVVDGATENRCEPFRCPEQIDLSHTEPAAVFFDEFDAGHFQGTPNRQVIGCRR